MMGLPHHFSSPPLCATKLQNRRIGHTAQMLCSYVASLRRCVRISFCFLAILLGCAVGQRFFTHATTQRKSGRRFHIWMEWFTKGTKKCLMLVSEVTVQMEGFAKMHNIFVININKLDVPHPAQYATEAAIAPLRLLPIQNQALR